MSFAIILSWKIGTAQKHDQLVCTDFLNISQLIDQCILKYCIPGFSTVMPQPPQRFPFICNNLKNMYVGINS